MLGIMKRKKKITLLILTVAFIVIGYAFDKKRRSALSDIWFVNSELEYTVATLEESKAEFRHENLLQLGYSFVGFKEALAFKESQGIYDIINAYGYVGKYQFAPTSLNAVGVTDIEAFRLDSKLQENAFLAFTSRNKYLLRNYIDKYEGKVINGVKITESGMLAAAHLAGAGNVKKYLRSHGTHQFNDAYGTSLQSYLKRYSGYNTSIIPADANAIVSL